MSYTIHIDTKDSVKSIEELKKKVESLKKSLESMDKSSSSFTKTSKELAKAQKDLANAQKKLSDQASKTSSSMKDLDSNTKKVSSNLDKSTKSSKSASDNFKMMREEIRDLRSAFYGTKEGTEEYKKALSALGDKMQEFKDMQAAANASALDFGAVCGNLVGVANGVVGGISALSGAMQIFGIGNSEFLEKLQSKSVAVIQVVQGLAAVEDALTKKLPLLKNVYQQLNDKLVENIQNRKLARTAAEAQAVSEVANIGATTGQVTAMTALTAAEGANATASAAVVTSNTAVQDAFDDTSSSLHLLRRELDAVNERMAANAAAAAKYNSANGIFDPHLGDAISQSMDKMRAADITKDIKLVEKYGDAAVESSDRLKNLAASGKASSDSMKGAGAAAQASSVSMKAASKSGNLLTKTFKQLKDTLKSNPLMLIIMSIPVLVAAIKKLIGWMGKLSSTKVVFKDIDAEIQGMRNDVQLLNEDLQHLVNIGQMARKAAMESELDLLKEQRDELSQDLQESLDLEHVLSNKKHFLGVGKKEDDETLDKAAEQTKALKDEIKDLDNKIKLLNYSLEELAYQEGQAAEGGLSAGSSMESLESWLETFKDSLKTELELLDKAHAEELAKLRESLNAGLLTQEQYNDLLLKSNQKYLEKRKELMAKSNDDLKKLMEELKSWESEQESPLNKIIDEFNEGKDILDKSLEDSEISYEEYLKAMETLSARYAQKIRKELFSKVSADVDKLKDKMQRESSSTASGYDVKISDAESHGKVVDAVQLRIDKETELFRLEQEGIKEQIALWEQAAGSFRKGSEEQVEALEHVQEAQEQMNMSVNAHKIAQKENEQAMADAEIGYRSFNDAIKDYLNLSPKQANALEIGIDMAGDLINELGTTLSAFADEALAQSENEELTEEAREKAFQQYKNLQVAQTTIDYMSGLMAAWKSAAEMPSPFSWIYGGAMTGMLTTQYAMSLKSIKKQTMDSPSTETGSSSSSVSIASPTYTTAEANIQAARPASDTRVYVLESDISRVQSKNKVRVNETTF